MGMVTIYLAKSEQDFPELRDKIVRLNNVWFNKHWEDYDFTLRKNSNILERIDETKYIYPDKIESKFNPGTVVTIYDLSTGAKTALNIANNNEMIFNLAECGRNALDEICKLENGNGILYGFYSVTRELKMQVKLVSTTGKTKVVTTGREMNNTLYKYYMEE